ncbi:hypothetical protein GOV13_04915 [Candidatus Pacearchaeota archaeon]|nr:hypothetical protein [Candidatus Pacearchaeota archaeon]
MKKELVLITCILFLTSFVFAVSMTGSAIANNSNQNQVQSNTNDGIEIQDTNNSARPGKLSSYKIRTIKRTQNRIKANTEPGNCPENCRCQGAITTCQFKNREMTIRAGESGNTIMKVKDAEMKTKIEMYKAEGEVYGIFRNNETRVIKILPDEVREKMRKRLKQRDCDCEDIELDEDGVYNVQAKKRARFLGFIPVREKVITKIDSETGEITKIKTSWWGFLARDVVDEDVSE